MAKEKIKGAKGVPNRHLHARVAFLHQAALHLARASKDSQDHADASLTRAPPSDGLDTSSVAGVKPSHSTTTGLPHHLSSQLRQVALKAQIRLDTSVKRGFCKTCNGVLLEGETCYKFTENLSRGGQKPHADMLVLECMACGTKKRFPTTTMRQRKKGERRKISSADAGVAVISPSK